MSQPLALTNQVNYSLKPTSLKATRKTVSLPSSNKTSFNGGDTVVFFLPSLKSHVMDGKSAYLRYRFTPVGGNAYLDHSAQSVINRITTYCSGQVISDIQNYGALAASLLDCHMSIAEKVGLSAMWGTESLIANNRQGQSLTSNTEYFFAIPLIHPLFSLSEKSWPTFALTDDTRIEIVLSSTTDALVGTPTSYTLANPELVVDYIQFDDDVIHMIQQTYAGRDLIVPVQDYRLYSSSIVAGTNGSISQIIPCKVQSARMALFNFRPAATQGANSYTLSSRVNPFYTAGDYFNLNIGGVRLPAKPITTVTTGNFASYQAELQKGLHALNALEMNGAMTSTLYNVWCASGTYQGAGSSYSNAFLIGINLDLLRGSSETMNSGTNLSSVTTYWEGYLANAATNYNSSTTTNVTVDSYILFDALIVIGADGNTTLRF